MAHAKKTVQLILDLYTKGYFKDFQTVIEIGSQDLNFIPRTKLLDLLIEETSFDPVHLHEVFSRAIKKSTSDDFSPDWFFELLGFDKYKCVDADGRHDSFVWDLNLPIPPEQRSTYDLVTNSGTTEHVFNVAQVFKNIHDLARKGSIMIHVVPFQGYINHGFYNYQPCFFEDLAFENQYTIIQKYVIVDEIGSPDSAESAEMMPYSEKEFLDVFKNDKKTEAVLYYALKKEEDSDFRIPFQGIYDPFLLTSYKRTFLEKASQKFAMTFFNGPNSVGRRITKLAKRCLFSDKM